MTNLKNALTYGLVLMGAAFLLIVVLSGVFFGDVVHTDSYKPLWVVVPVFLGVGGYLIYKSTKK